MTLKSGFNKLWPTDVYLGNIDSKICDITSKYIFENYDLNSFNSDFQKTDLLNNELTFFRDQVVFPEFKKYLNYWNIDIDAFPDKRVKSWITGSQTGYMVPIHNHSGATLSCVFYLFAEEKNFGGELVLADPRTNANRGYKDHFKPLFENKHYLPNTGEFIIFPSYLYHHTVPFTGNIRLAMPVDLFL